MKENLNTKPPSVKETTINLMLISFYRMLIQIMEETYYIRTHQDVQGWQLFFNEMVSTRSSYLLNISYDFYVVQLQSVTVLENGTYFPPPLPYYLVPRLSKRLTCHTMLSKILKHLYGRGGGGKKSHACC